ESMPLLLEPVALGAPLGETGLRPFFPRIPCRQQSVGMQQRGFAVRQARARGGEGTCFLTVLVLALPQVSLNLTMTRTKALELLLDVRQRYLRRERFLLQV